MGTGVAQHPESTHREPGLVNPAVDNQRLMFNWPCLIQDATLPTSRLKCTWECELHGELLVTVSQLSGLKTFCYLPCLKQGIGVAIHKTSQGNSVRFLFGALQFVSPFHTHHLLCSIEAELLRSLYG